MKNTKWNAVDAARLAFFIFHFSFFISLSSILATSSLFADTLVLADGRRVTGDVMQIGGRYMVKTASGSVTFGADEVVKWEKGAAAVAAAGPTAVGQMKVDPALLAARAAKLIDQGGAALHAGDAQAALENFLDAKSLLERQHVRLDPNDPNHVAILEGIGAAYLAIGRYEKANDPLDRAYVSNLKGKSLIINHAILDLVQKVNVMHAIKELKDFIARQPAPAEMAMNVLGASLGLVSNDEHFFQTAFFQDVGKFYLAKTKELEATRRGEKRWGTQWLSSVQAKVHLDAEVAGLRKYQAAIEDVRDAEQAVKAAQAQRDGASSTGAVTEANNRLARAKDNLAYKMGAQKEAWKSIPRPDWPRSFPPVLPEFAGGGVFGAPAAPQPAQVAIALPAKPPVAPPLVPDSQAKVNPPRAPNPPLPEPEKHDTPSAEVARPPKHMIARNAVAVPVGPDLLLTAAAQLEGAVDFKLETADSNILTAELVRKDPACGLALLRLKGQSMPYLNLASSFTGGDVTCWGFPEVSIFSPVPEAITGTTQAPKADNWKVNLRRHPRLAAAAVLDKSGALVGIALGDRDSVMTQIPTVTLEQIRAFLGPDAPKALCSNPNPSGVMQLTASREAQ